MLSYYFNVVQYFKFVKQENKSTHNTTSYDEINNLILSNLSTIFSTIISSINTTFTTAELDLINEHSDYIETCSKNYDELSAMGADTSKCTLISSQYNKYIKNFNKKILGSLDNDSKLDGISKFYYGQSALFHQLISPLSKLKESRKRDYYYTDVTDVCKYFLDNPIEYDRMVDEGGKNHLFKLTNQSIGSYMSALSRFWTPKKVNGKVVYRVK